MPGERNERMQGDDRGAKDRTMLLKRAAGALVGMGALALSALWKIPMQPAPLTLQSLTLVLWAGFFGGRSAAMAAAFYLAAALLGLPLLASGTSGRALLASPAFGYLAGFIPAALLAGWMIGRALCGGSQGGPLLARLLGAGLLAHAIILAVATLWFAMFLGWEVRRIVAVGIVPFLPGAGIKAAAAALVLMFSPSYARHADTRRQS
jgi:biotin transport system substrate-specific component